MDVFRTADDADAHGHTRATFDVDFLVRRAQRDAWFARLIAAGLQVFGETDTFAQFSQGAGGEGLDLKYGSRELYDPFLRLLRTP